MQTEQQTAEVNTAMLTLAAPPPEIPAEIADALLALADDELIIGHRHSEWLGLSPFLEEDLTLASIAQDELGHARALYALIWPSWQTRDAGVTRRQASEWRSCEFVEQQGFPWEWSLVRHFLYDHAEPYRWRGLVDMYADDVRGLADLAKTVLAEERFHARHATDLVKRLGADTAGAEKLQPFLNGAAVDELANGMTSNGWAAFVTEVHSILSITQLQATLPAEPKPTVRQTRSNSFGEIQQSLLSVVAYDPTASW